MAVFTVNGQKVEPTGNQKLLRFLRDELHLTSVKDGCSEGACGACTVIIDGKTCKACVPDTDLLDGRTVITVEGLTEWEREYTYAYGKAGAVQCGFCIPGMVMCTKALLDVNKEPTDDEIKYALRNNYCRCTGYVKIMDAVRLAAKVLKTGVIPDDGDPDWNIGHRVSRVDVEEKYWEPANIRMIFTLTECCMAWHSEVNIHVHVYLRLIQQSKGTFRGRSGINSRGHSGRENRSDI